MLAVIIFASIVRTVVFSRAVQLTAGKLGQAAHRGVQLSALRIEQSTFNRVEKRTATFDSFTRPTPNTTIDSDAKGTLTGEEKPIAAVNTLVCPTLSEMLNSDMVAADTLGTVNTSERTAAFPVVMLAHARLDRLSKTLGSLCNVRGVDARQVFVIQDGGDDHEREQAAKLVRNHGFRIIQLPPLDTPKARGGRIAAAYKRALSLAFDELSKDEAILIVEDDLLFAPDLMEYMLAGWSAMAADPTIWCVSAWNDNGFHGLTSAVHASKRLLRTGFFPGLGWLLSRRLYKVRALEHARH